MNNAAAMFACLSGLSLAIGLLPSRQPQPYGTALCFGMSLVYAATSVSILRSAA